MQEFMNCFILNFQGDHLITECLYKTENRPNITWVKYIFESKNYQRKNKS